MVLVPVGVRSCGWVVFAVMARRGIKSDHNVTVVAEAPRHRVFCVRGLGCFHFWVEPWMTLSLKSK